MRVHHSVSRRACLFLVLVLCSAVLAQRPRAEPSFRVRLAPVVQGNRQTNCGDKPERFRKTALFKTAQKAGVDIVSPDHPLVVHAFNEGRLYHLFYTFVEEAYGGPSYLIQRIKKTVKNYSGPNDTEPETTVTYKVEALKLRGGNEIHPDQHHGYYVLRDCSKREIIKEFEIGFGQIEGIAEGESWPFERKTLFRLIQKWDTKPGAYDRVEFAYSKKWTLSVSFDRGGNYSVKAPELGIDAPGTLPDPDASKPWVDPSSVDVVVTAGEGVGELVIGQSRAEDVGRVLGPPLDVQRANERANNYVCRKGLVFHIWNDGPVKTIFTRSSFGGKTSKGIRLGDTRERVLEVYGEPTTAKDDHLLYPGIIFYLDGEGRVSSLTVADKSVGAHKPEAQEEAGPKYEYKVVTEPDIKRLAADGDDPLTAGLNRLGNDGWELAGITAEGLYIFKRAK